MYIRKQPSGSTDATATQAQRGRGEYEINGPFDSVPPILPQQLFDHQLFIRFGKYGYKPTGAALRNKWGKKRLHLMEHDGERGIHVARQVQAALLLPEPRRDEHGLIGGQPTIMLKRYIVRRMNLSDVRLPAPDR